MSWELTIHTPTKSAVRKTLTPLTSSGIDGGFTWQLDPNRNAVQLRFRGRNDLLGIQPRDILHLKIGPKSVFYGVVVRPPNPRSHQSEEIAVIGAREILKRRVMDSTIYEGMGVYAILRDIAARLLPGSGVTYNPNAIGNGSGIDTGPILSRFYMPTSTLDEVLTTLEKAAGVPGGVDETGTLYLGRPAPAPLNIAYETQDLAWLPVEAEDTVTRAILRVVTAPSEGLSVETVYNAPGTLYTIPYFPLAVVKEAVGANHATYQASSSITPPAGLPLFKETYLPLGNFTGFTDREAATDGDLTTFASQTNAGSALINWGNGPGGTPIPAGERMVGVKLVYEVSQESSANLDLYYYANPSGYYYDHARLALQPTGGVTTRYVFLPPSLTTTQQGQLAREIRVATNSGTPAGGVRIFEVAALIVDEAIALKAAESYLQEPASVPTQITVEGFQAPTTSVTITGAPGGNVTGSASLFEYAYDAPRGLRTLVRLGATGQSEQARLIRLQADRAAARATNDAVAFVQGRR